MGRRKDLSDFDRGQIVMARQLGESLSKTAALVGCSRSTVVSIYQKWSKEGIAVNRRQGHGRPRLIDARGEERLARVVESNRDATVAEIAKMVNAGSDRKVSEHTVHRSLLRMGLPVHCRKQGLNALADQCIKSSTWHVISSEELSDFVRGTVIGCYRCLKSVHEISDLLDLPRPTITAIITKWKQLGTTVQPQSDGPKTPTAADCQGV